MQSMTFVCQNCGKTLDVTFCVERHAIIVGVCDCQIDNHNDADRATPCPTTSDSKRKAAIRSWRHRLRQKGVSESEISRLELIRYPVTTNVTSRHPTTEIHDATVTQRDAYANTVTQRDDECDASRKNRDATVTQRDAYAYAAENNNTILNTINTNTSLSSETVTRDTSAITRRHANDRDANDHQTMMREKGFFAKDSNFEIHDAVEHWTPPIMPEDSQYSVADFREMVVKLATLDAGYLAYARNQRDVAFNAWFFDLSTIPKKWLLRAIQSYYLTRRKPDFVRPDPLHLSQYIRGLARLERDREDNERQRVLAEIQRATPEKLKLDWNWSRETLREHLLQLPPILRDLPWKKWHERRGILEFEPITTKEYSR